MKYYLVIKSKEELIHVITWMNHVNMLNVRLRHKRSYVLQFHLCEIFRIGEYIETKSRLVVTKGCRKKGMGNEYWVRVSFGDD